MYLEAWDPSEYETRMMLQIYQIYQIYPDDEPLPPLAVMGPAQRG